MSPQKDIKHSEEMEKNYSGEYEKNWEPLSPVLPPPVCYDQ